MVTDRNFPPETNEKTARLSTLLRQQAELLVLYGEDSWANYFAPLSKKCESLEKGFLAETILQVYKGMGSFSDVVITHKNGRELKRFEMIEVNTELSYLSRQIYNIAVELLIESRRHN